MDSSDADVARPQVAILDYGMGNLRSVHRAFIAVGANARLVTDPAQLADAAALVFPGQGAIVDTMRLLQTSGWAAVIRDWIAADRPFFGICLGLQALFEHSEEGDTRGLGIFPGRVVRFPSGMGAGHKVPHMGWNRVEFSAAGNLLNGLSTSGEAFYFVHSYHVADSDPAITWGTTDYAGLRFVSAIHKGRVIATQFHPEKSQAKGLQLYRNFVAAL